MAAILLLGGCSSPDSTGSRTPSLPETVTSSVQELPVYREIRPEGSSSEALPAGWVVRPVASEGVALLAPRELRVSFGGLPEVSFKLTLAEIRETPAAITIDLLGASPEGEVTPSGPAASYQHTFKLGADLGHREVILNGRAVPIAIAE